MRGLQVLVGFVLRQAVAVVGDADNLVSRVLANAIVLSRSLVDVIAQVDNKVEIFLRHVLQSGEVARLIVLTGGEGKAHLVEHAAGLGGRAGAANGRDLASGLELIVVPAIRAEAVDFHMHRVRQLLFRGRLAAGHDLAHALVLGDLILDGHVVAVHAALVQRVRRQAGPQEKTVRGRFSGSYPKAERVGRKLRGLRRRAPWSLGESRKGGKGGQKLAASENRWGHGSTSVQPYRNPPIAWLDRNPSVRVRGCLQDQLESPVQFESPVARGSERPAAFRPVTPRW